MRPAIAIFLIVFATTSPGQESDPFSVPIVTEEVAPLRNISSRPSSITYERVDDKHHRYTVTGIYNASQKAKEEAKENKRKESRVGQSVTDPFAPDGHSR